MTSIINLIKRMFADDVNNYITQSGGEWCIEYTRHISKRNNNGTYVPMI